MPKQKQFRGSDGNIYSASDADHKGVQMKNNGTLEFFIAKTDAFALLVSDKAWLRTKVPVKVSSPSYFVHWLTRGGAHSNFSEGGRSAAYRVWEQNNPKATDNEKIEQLVSLGVRLTP
jgi:hypothetical protein